MGRPRLKGLSGTDAMIALRLLAVHEEETMRLGNLLSRVAGIEFRDRALKTIEKIRLTRFAIERLIREHHVELDIEVHKFEPRIEEPPDHAATLGVLDKIAI